MKDVQHTPGPWRISKLDSGPYEALLILGKGGMDIATIDFGDFKKERTANAKLIAEAPRMLDALQHIIAVAATTAVLPDEMLWAIDAAEVVVGKITKQ